MHARQRARLFLWYLLIYYQITGAQRQTKDLEDTNKTRIIEEFRSVCPYTETCFANFTKLFPIEKRPELVAMDEPSEVPCCDQCHCDQRCAETCRCCPDNQPSLVDKPKFTCRYLDTIQFDHLDGPIFPPRRSYYMVTDCSPQFGDDVIIGRCTSNIQVPIRLEDVQPVVSRTDGTIYKNSFCASCNNERLYTKFTPGKGILYRREFSEEEQKAIALSVYFTDTSEYSSNSALFYNFIHPYSNDAEKNARCSIVTFSSCNETGEIKTRDDFLEAACSAYVSPFSDSLGTVYKNVHCYACNTGSMPADTICVTMPPHGIEESMLSILQYREDGQQLSTEDECSSEQFFDPYLKICRTKGCPLLQTWQNGTCTPSLPMTIPTIKIIVVPFTTNAPYESYLDIAKTLLAKVHDEALFGYDPSTLNCGEVYKSDERDLTSAPSFFLHYAWSALRTSTLMEDMPYFVNKLIKGYDVSISSNIHFTLRLVPLWIPELDMSGPRLNNRCTSVDHFHVDGVRMSFLHKLDNVFLDGSFKIIVLALHVCPTVELQADEFRLRNDTAELKHNTLRLPISRYLALKESRIIVCLDDYLVQTNPVDRIIPLNIVSLVCTSLSALGLLILLLTYSTLKDLRSLPGKINMCLSGTLLLAQVLQQVALDLVQYPLFCSVSGSVIHYLWLSTVLWMNCSSFNVYRTFGNPYLFDTLLNKVHPLCVYCIYSFGLPLLFVGINVGVALFISGGLEWGYGGSVCYISSKAMVGYTFSLPVGMLLVFNAILLCMSIYHIRSTPSVERASGIEKNNSVIFLKLSTLTGVCWVFGYLAIWTQLEVFAYLFIIANASQGVFLFFAFVCTRKVFNAFGLFLPPSSSTNPSVS